MRPLLGKLGRVLLLVAASVVGLEALLQALHLAFFAGAEPRVALPEGSGRLRILCIGESTTWGYPDGPDSPDAYPSILARRLAEEFPDLPIDVVNEGRRAVTSATILEQLPSWLERYEPRIVVAMLGQNDHFYHSEAFERWLPAAWARWLQKLRTLRLAGLVREQLRRSLGSAGDPADAISHEHYLHIVGVYQRGAADYDAGRLRDAQRHFEQLRDLVLAERRDEPATSASRSRIPSLLLGPFYDAATYLSKIYVRTGRAPAAIRLYEGLVALEPELPIPYMELSNLYELTGQPEAAARARSTGETLLAKYVLRATQNHYRAIRDAAAASGAVLVAMQYPLRDVNTLRALFPDDVGLRLVDNRDAFVRALEAAPYPHWFSDRFAGDFGHLTRAGNELLVENLLAQAVRPLLAPLSASAP